jgi:hypothetical protein
MMLRSRVALAAIAPVAIALAACSSRSDAPTSPAERQPLDVGQLFAELSPPGMARVAAAMPIALPIPGTATAFGGATCPYVAASSSFVCAPTTANGLTVTLAYQLFDAAGHTQSAPDRSTTASLHAVSTVDGTLTLPASGAFAVGPLAIAGRQETTLTGLLGATHTVNGTSTTKLTGTLTVSGQATPMASTVTATTKDLVLPAPTTGSSAPPYPTSGTVTIDASVSAGAGTPAVTTHAQVTFDGTSTATVTFTVGGVTQRCTVNLATAAAPVCTAGR